MQLNVFSIRDSKAEIFNPPFIKQTHGEAERDFHRMVKNPESLPHQYPEDYDLYHLGTFDDQTGEITRLEKPQRLVNATQLKQPLN